MTRFLIAASFVTLACMLSGWAHAAPARRCVIITEGDGTQVLVCAKVPVVVVSR